MTTTLKLLRTAIASAALAVIGSAAYGLPDTLSAASNVSSFTWAFDGDNDGTAELKGSGSMTASGFDSTSLSLVISLSNTSPIGGIGGQRLTSFGFGITPNATGIDFADAADGGMVGASLASIPSLQGIEVCAYGGQNCAGGANGGIFGGASDIFTLSLAGNWLSSVQIDLYGFKYQTGYGSFEFNSSSSGVGTSGSGRVPEPSSSSLALLGLGLLGAGFYARRKSQQG